MLLNSVMLQWISTTLRIFYKKRSTGPVPLETYFIWIFLMEAIGSLNLMIGGHFKLLNLVLFPQMIYRMYNCVSCDVGNYSSILF